MGRLIEQQAVIDCLTNTAKYYEREDADEWTRGMRYGLLHGVDNILDNVPTVEAIPKDQYEARLKADLEAMLTEIQLEIEELKNEPACCQHYKRGVNRSSDIIQEKINALKGRENDTSGKTKTRHRADECRRRSKPSGLGTVPPDKHS